MSFASIQFLLFLPLVFSVYYIRPTIRWQNAVSVLASYYFYGWWDYRFCALLFGTSALDYWLGARIAKTDRPAARRTLLILSLVSNLGLLGFFKYYNFFVSSLVLALDKAGDYDKLALQQVISYRPGNIRYLNYEQLTDLLIDHGLALFCELARRAIYVDRSASLRFAEKQFPYARHGFNQRGDFMAHYGLAQTNMPSVLLADGTAPQVNDTLLASAQVLGRLRIFADCCRQRGAVVVYSCPPHPPDYLAQERPTLEAILNQLKEIRYLELIDRPEDQVYPRDQFFDSIYHLTREGTTERTERLIRSLRKYLPERGAPRF